MNNKSQLRQFILENYLFTDDESQLDDSQSFLSSGILDSMGILELVAFLNDDLQVKVETHEMIPDNLDSIDNLMRFIDNKKS
jgi:acyl carrier protein